MSKQQLINEEQLVQGLLNKDKWALKELYDQYAGYLSAVCARYITNREDVNDVLQESFILIFTSIDKFTYRGEGALKAWITKIVVNESLRHLKKVQKIDFITPTWDLPDTEEDITPFFDDIPITIIQEMIRNLPVGYRTVFNLFVFEGKSHKEIAQILNIAENSSASQLHRAKSILAKQIKELETHKQLQNG